MNISKQSVRGLVNKVACAAVCATASISTAAAAPDLSRVSSLIHRGDPNVPQLLITSEGKFLQDPRQPVWKIDATQHGKGLEATHEALIVRIAADPGDKTRTVVSMKANPKDYDALLGWSGNFDESKLNSVTQCFSDNTCVTATPSRCEDAKEMADVKNMRELMQLLRKCDKVISATLPSSDKNFQSESQRNIATIKSITGSKAALEEAKVTAPQFLIGMGDACEALGDPPKANPSTTPTTTGVHR